MCKEICLKKLPKLIKYDLEGYRGCGVMDFPLKVEYNEECDMFVAHYSNDLAGVCISVAWGKIKKEALSALKKNLNRDLICISKKIKLL